MPPVTFSISSISLSGLSPYLLALSDDKNANACNL
nr:MAG TPA: hypothetical protein [Caudoviricetes sp.]